MSWGCDLSKSHNQSKPPGLLTFGQFSCQLPWAIFWEEHKDMHWSIRQVHHPDTTLVEICPFLLLWNAIGSVCSCPVGWSASRMGRLMRGEKTSGLDTSTGMSQAGWTAWSEPRQCLLPEVFAKNSFIQVDMWSIRTASISWWKFRSWPPCQRTIPF